jgi:hypothetical protein
MELNDPRSMKQEALMKFFRYIASREVSHGIQDAFKFKAVLSSRKKGVLQKSMYNDGDEELELTPARPRRKKRIEKEGHKKAGEEIPTETRNSPAQVSDRDRDISRPSTTDPIEVEDFHGNTEQITPRRSTRNHTVNEIDQTSPESEIPPNRRSSRLSTRR